MTSQQKQEAFVPIFLSLEEYNEIIKQPPNMHQQLFQEIYSKQQQQQQAQLQLQQQMHPYLQLQQQSINQSQSYNPQIAIPKIPTHPNQYSQINSQGLPYQYTQQQQYNLNQYLIQNLNQAQKEQIQPLKHDAISKAGKLELQYFFEWSTSLFIIEICISLFINTISALFRWELITGYYSWSPQLWVILSVFIILNLFILTNPAYITHNNNQKVFYWIHAILYVLLLQGLQIAVSGSNRIFAWDTNYFYYFYLIICVEFISIRYAIKRLGLQKSIKKYTHFIIFPPIIAYLLEFISQYYRFFYYPLFLWVIIVMLIGSGFILLINKIVEKGYNKFQTDHVFAMAISFPILMISPFYDNDDE
ncbi:unnamed protein product [Paramecium sonneborni]|uniref:Transmembrane protein n=1 Tax=Paramecium sonneborni TaxID=65129 RepID=A0A8S1LHK7_9CILI|nr:unnamed protein product [Paramecium sonneborni]